jgi:predicted methyltransferase MtxX (methanogen marker protein 4)
MVGSGLPGLMAVLALLVLTSAALADVGMDKDSETDSSLENDALTAVHADNQLVTPSVAEATVVSGGRESSVGGDSGTTAAGEARVTPQPIIYQQIVKTADLLQNGRQR